MRLASADRKRQVGTIDLGEQEEVATQTRREENDQLIGCLAQQKAASRILARPEIERAKACAHAVRCVIPAPQVVDITTKPSPTTTFSTLLQCSQAADAHALQHTSFIFSLTSTSRAQCLECIDESPRHPRPPRPTPPSHDATYPTPPHHVCSCEVTRAPGQNGNTTSQSQITSTKSTSNNNMFPEEDNTTPVVCCDKQDDAGQAVLHQRITANGHPR